MEEKKKIYLLVGVFSGEAGYDIPRAYFSRELAKQDLKLIDNFSDRDWVIEEVEIFDTKDLV